MKKYETVIFDLDGTLLYTLEDLTKATNYALRRMNMPERTLDAVSYTHLTLPTKA